MTDCVFCQIVAGDSPATVAHKYLDAVVFVPLNPVVEGHLLVVPTKHVSDAAEDPEVTGSTFRIASYIAKKMRRAGIDSNLITSIGPAATQTVMHLHVHVVPRRSGDGLTLPWTGQLVEHAR